MFHAININLKHAGFGVIIVIKLLSIAYTITRNKCLHLLKLQSAEYCDNFRVRRHVCQKTEVAFVKTHFTDNLCSFFSVYKTKVTFNVEKYV